MNWGGAPSGTGTGAGRSGWLGPAGGVVAGAGSGARGALGGGGAAAGGEAGRGEAVTGGRRRAPQGRRLGRPTRRSRLAEPRSRGRERGPRDPRGGTAGRVADSGRSTLGSDTRRSVLGSESPWLATRTVSGAAAAHARMSSPAARAARGTSIAQTRPARRRWRARIRPEDAEVAIGAAKIERPAPAAPSGDASTGAGTSKTLRRSSFELSEVKGIYVREARTLKTGPPAPGRAGQCDRTVASS